MSQEQNDPELNALRENAIRKRIETSSDDPMVKYIRDNSEIRKGSENTSNSSNYLSSRFIKKPDDNTLPWSWSYFGGANVSQTGNGNLSLTELPSAGSIALDTKSDLGVVAGLKVGYTFKPLIRCKDVELKPAVEFEAFYNGFNYTGSHSETVPPLTVIGGVPIPAGTYTGELKAHVNSATFSFNPILKMRVSFLQPYIGAGVGGTYLTIGDVKVTVQELPPGGVTASATLPSNNAHDFAFTAQGIAGVDFLITKRISIFSEYKYVHYTDVNLSGSLLTGKFDSFGQNIIIGGFRINF